jgi:glycosyltransferase involved in cell wall biosynthesis
MENSPLISFIIPYYNAGNTIQETIDSIFAQTFTNFDVWIVNDGSTDAQSIDKLRDFEGNDNIHVIHQDNAGPSVARNRAIRATKADYIVPIDADDLLEENTLSHAMDFLESHPSTPILYGNLRYFGERNEIHVQEPFSIQKQLLWNQLAVCAFIRKDVFNQLDGYDEHLSHLGLEDWEFWIRAHSSGFTFKKLEKTFFAIRVVSTSRTYTQANPKIAEIRAYVYRKHASLLANSYKELFYALKMERELPDYALGKFLLAPYRWIKRIWK